MNDDDFKDKNKPDFDGDKFGDSLLANVDKKPVNDDDKELSSSDDKPKFASDDKAPDSMPSDDKSLNSLDSEDKSLNSLDSEDKSLNSLTNDDSDKDYKSNMDDNNQSKPKDDQPDSPAEELPTKSKTELELERVESIEHLSLSASDPADKTADKADLTDEIESVLAEDSAKQTDSKSDSSAKEGKINGVSLKAGDLPVAHPEDNKKKVSLEDIIKNQTTEKQASKKPIIWMALTAILLLVAIGAGGLYYFATDQHSQQQAKLQSELDAEKLASAKLQKDLQAAKASQDEQDKPADQSGDFNLISEWDVKYPLDQTTADLTYSYSLYTIGQTEVERLAFSTTEISAIKEGTGQSMSYPCDSTKAPVGWIERLTVEEFEAVKKSVAGTPMADAYNEMDLVKLGDYYYKTGTSQNVCSDQLQQTNYADKLKAVESLPKKFVISQ